MTYCTGTVQRLVSRIIQGIPLVGDLLIGDDGSGIFGWGFLIEGSLDDPKVSANPLSGIEPAVIEELRQ